MRKTMKKIFAFMLAMTMLIGMTITVSANADATIRVENATDAKLSMVQLIEPDQTSTTGWKFCSEAIEAIFINRGLTLEAIITIDNGTSSGEMAKALDDIANSQTYLPMANPQAVKVAGLYAIKATETGYTYNNMSVFVPYNSTETIQVVAKKSPTSVGKAVNDEDAVTEIGKVVTYTITTHVPYILPNTTNKYFAISDKIIGADYYNMTSAKVMMGDVELDVEFKVTENKFTVDLSKACIDETNSNAGKEIVVTYDAIITGLGVENIASSHVSDSKFDSDAVKLITGSITLTKYAADDTPDDLSNNTKLAGAEFLMSNEDGEYAEFDENYNFVKWVADMGDATTLVTGEDGTLTVSGLDVGTYTFEETKAPEGFSLNAEPVKATIAKTTLEGEEVALGSTYIINSTLSALPGTGGIGTTIFTIGGCLIMLLAAALFFASRRKSTKE